MRIKLHVALSACVLVMASAAQAKDKFSRATVDSTGAVNQPGAAQSGTVGDAVSKDAKKSADGKVDITNLENRYWTAKDSEFSVVQNRLYTKTKRFSVTPIFGAGFNDPYESNIHLGGSIDYFFSEREGVGIYGWRTTATDSKIIGNIGSNGAAPDRNLQQGYVGAFYTWVPIYAKLSLLEKKIMYFDMGISPGIGATMLNSATFGATQNAYQPPSAVNQTALTGSLDIYQQLFITEHWAVKLQLVNHFYSENLYGAVSGQNKSSQFTYSGSVLLGVSFFQ